MSWIRHTRSRGRHATRRVALATAVVAFGFAEASQRASASGPGPDVPASATTTLEAALRCGDEAWLRRAAAESANPTGPADREALAAISCFRRARDLDAERLETHWKLLRALWFAGEFASDGSDLRARRFSEARSAAETGLGRLERRLGRAPREASVEEHRAALAENERNDAAQLHFWAALAWGSWSRGQGLLATVREGVASRMRDHARIAVGLAPRVERGGPQRLLARLHTSLPRVPFVTGWVDRQEGLRWAERAHAIEPGFAGNQLALAITLLDLGRHDRRPEAIRLLRTAAAAEPAGPDRIEEEAIRDEAARRLEAVDTSGSLPRPSP